MAGSNTMSSKGVETLDIATAVISLLVILIRLYIQGYFSRFSSSDLFIVLAWIFFVGNSITDFYSKRLGFWDPRIDYTTDGILPKFEEIIPDRNMMRKGFLMLYSTATFYHISLYFVKMAFLMMYREMFPSSMTKLRKALWCSIVIVTAGYFIIVVQQFFWCVPVRRNWTMVPEERCLSWAAPIPWFFAAGFHIVSDILVYALPFFLLPTLIAHASPRKILGIAIMFSLGLLCIMCTVGRLINVGRNANPAVVSAWCTAESFSSLIVACILPLKRMYMAWSFRGTKMTRTHSSRSRSLVRTKSSPEMHHSWTKGLAFWRTTRRGSEGRLTDDGDVEATGIRTPKRSRTWGLDSTRDATHMGFTTFNGTNESEIGGLAPRKSSRNDDDEIIAVESHRMSLQLPPPPRNRENVEQQEKEKTNKSGRWKWRWTTSSSNETQHATTTKSNAMSVFGVGKEKKNKPKALGNLTFGSSGLDRSALGSPGIPRRESTASLSPRGPGPRSSGIQPSALGDSAGSDEALGLDAERGDRSGKCEHEYAGSIHSMTFGKH